MFASYLMKRNSSSKSPPMQRVYCVLWGTLLMDFDSEEEANLSLTPKCIVEVIGVSKWDGEGRNASYPNGFLAVTHMGGTYYMSASTPEQRTQWILHIRASLECNFANTELVEFKPSKACFDPPAPVGNTQCPRTAAALGSGGVLCRCCGRSFSPEHMTESAPVLQIGAEEAARTCSDCREAQACLVWLKSLVYVHTLSLHERTEEVLAGVDRFKASFKIRRKVSKRLDQAAELKEQHQLSESEFEELRKVDHEYRQEVLLEECDRMRLALAALGNDMQSIIGFLRNPGATLTPAQQAGTGTRLYALVVVRMLQVADEDPDLIDFYWPQVLQVHLLLSKTRSCTSLAVLDVLQQGVLAVALRFPHLAMKLSWSLLASIGDYKEGRISQAQYAACVCLLLQLEVLTYGVASSLTDAQPPSPSVPSEGIPVTPNTMEAPERSVLQKILTPAHHQKQELMIELYTLMRVRKKVLVDQEREAAERRGLGATKPALTMSVVQQGQRVCDSSECDCTGDVGGTEVTPKCVDLFLWQGAEGGERGVWKGLSAQLDFIERLTELVDGLRNVDRPLRTEHFKTELLKQFTDSGGILLQWGLDPTGAAGEPCYRINRIYLQECRVFRTKARAPSLVVFEVVLDDGRAVGVGNGVPGENPHTPQRRHHISIVGEGAGTGEVDVSGILQEKLTKTVQDMSRERVSEADDVIQQEDSGGVALPPGMVVPARQQRLMQQGASQRGRRLGSSNNVRAGSSTGSSPSLEGDGERSRRVLVKDDDEADLDPLLAEGLPEVDAEITKQVISSANSLLQKGAITQEEYAVLVQSDFKYRDEAKTTDKELARARLESYYGEEWSKRKQRLLDSEPEGEGRKEQSVWSVTEYSNRNRSRTRSRSIPDGSDLDLAEVTSAEDNQDDWVLHGPAPPHVSGFESHSWPCRDLRSFIVKSNDDLRQEVACIQLIELCQEIFSEAGLDDMLWLKPYRIVSTGPSAGFVETLPNTLSIDAIKKTDGFVSLPKYFELLYGGSAQRLHVARCNYVVSLAAYSLVCYLFCIKDRHNGNILLDSEGHIIHIDFGFLLGIAPGGSFSVESAPFKLTDEMLEVFGGLDSHYFSMFVKSFTTGFLALRSKSTAILTAVEVMAQDSTFPCFQGKDCAGIVDKLRTRFRNDLSGTDAVEYCLNLIIQSYSNLGTKNYDTFQWYTNGIVP
mmetsp:Transcript_16896/g.25457  ORF Transcript_16896/g.25457 Transcript_16896/m.25457 type:complete len:1193 (+) Transcript_16896:119-3697(+)